MGLTFLALSSFPPFSQSCHSQGQQRESERGRMLCQLSRVTSALCFLGLMAINFQKAQNAMNYTKEHICMSALFSHIHIHANTNSNVYTRIQAHTHLAITSERGQGEKRAWVRVCVSSHAGQNDVPSHICQHQEFIYSVILSFVDLVTWSESERCRTLGTPESQAECDERQEPVT